jgi:hypothetical protein
MANFRTITALTVITGVTIFAAMSPATAQTVRATQTAVDQYVMVMKQLIGAAARARALADENPLLEPDAAYYEAELASTKACAPTVANLGPAR